MLINNRLGRRRGVARFAGITVLAAVLSSCSLEVNDPDVVTPEDVSDPASLPIAITGVVGDWAFAHGPYTRYAGLLVDDFMHAGTFPSRQQVDTRLVNPDNGSLTDGLYELIHVVRFSADNLVESAQSLVGDPDVDQDLVSEAIAIGQFYGGYARILLAEGYCHSILGGGDPENPNYESAPVLPDARMQDALSLLQAAEASATAAGLSDVATAAVVGQARALVFLGNYAQAATTVAGVPEGFEYMAEFSSNVPAQYNDVYDFTYGDFNFIRWTVGDGTAPERNFEKFAYYDEWVDAGLIEPSPDPTWATAQNSSIAVHLQLIYGGGNAPPNAAGQAAPILVASGFEADMYKAEAAYRAGDLAGAEAIINDRLTTGDNPYGAVFNAVDLTGTLSDDIAELARAYSAGTWLTGYRLGNLRRFVRNDSVDLYPSVQPGSDYSLPVVKQELDNNPDINQACPSGSTGSWPA